MMSGHLPSDPKPKCNVINRANRGLAAALLTADDIDVCTGPRKTVIKMERSPCGDQSCDPDVDPSSPINLGGNIKVINKDNLGVAAGIANFSRGPIVLTAESSLEVKSEGNKGVSAAILRAGRARIEVDEQQTKVVLE